MSLWRKQTCTQARDSDELDRAFRAIERLTAVGATLSALEWLAISNSMDDRGVFAWPIQRGNGPGGWKKQRKILDKILAHPWFTAVLTTRLLACFPLLLPNTGHGTRRACLGIMVASDAALVRRTSYGLDGSDDMAKINFCVALIEKFFRDDRDSRELAIAFAAAQSCLSYFVAGAAKLTSPTWRSGAAISGITRTRAYGDRFLYRIVKDRPGLARLLAWLVMLIETLFPTVLVAPAPIARLILLSGAGFHLANARYMGLPRFFWSFVGSYPAVAWCAKNVLPRRHEKGPGAS